MIPESEYDKLYHRIAAEVVAVRAEFRKKHSEQDLASDLLTVLVVLATRLGIVYGLDRATFTVACGGVYDAEKQAFTMAKEKHEWGELK